MTQEKEKRLEIIRQYILDVEEHPASGIESHESLSYIRWNFHRALVAAISEHDLQRGVRRTQVSMDQLDASRLIESPTVEVIVGQALRICGSKGPFTVWFHKYLLSPILAEEGRILKYSRTPRIGSCGTIRGAVERTGNAYLFKAWEHVTFPEAKDVPDEVEASLDETQTLPVQLE